tara:strand:+ start:492 stop:1670 length:1179 start_codon:yes stop_codon:yes gene_type:complete
MYSKVSELLEGQKMFQVLAQCKELEKQGMDIIHFEIGDPDFDTPKPVVDRCIKELRAGNTHYTKSAGLDSFKEVASLRTLKSRGFKPDYDQILVTQGANIQIYYALACIANPGDDVLTIDPCFVSYKSIFKFLGLNGIFIKLKEKNKFRLDPDDIEKFITKKTKAILINSPHNPTGSVMTEEEIKKVYDIAKKNNLWLISDEVYGRIVFSNDRTVFSSPSIYDKCLERTVIIHSFSKSYAMTGWRIGAITAPRELVRRMTLLLETITSCVSPFIQLAAEEALTSEQNYIEDMVETFRKRRDLMHELILDLPLISAVKPDGAFYTFVNIEKTGLSDEDFSERLLSEQGVATCPGSFFGDGGKGYVRFCFATDERNIKTGLERVKEFLQKITIS